MIEEKLWVKHPAKGLRDKTQLLEAVSPVGQNHDHHISRATPNFWMDVGLMLVFVSLAIVAHDCADCFFPETGAKERALWGMNFNQWSSLQYGLLCAFVFAGVIHVMLHWSSVGKIVRHFPRNGYMGRY